MDILYDMYEREKEGEVSECHIFVVDLNASIYKRFIQLIVDHIHSRVILPHPTDISRLFNCLSQFLDRFKS